ncbi:MAG: type I-E CRISPR-associated protein Cas5/CasD, partial [Gammaproteobacteria bacterium]|nr:type I-E CRISPR-associated protein Cas5/CasD [Gammaproteobacteria bacterium]
MRSYLLVRLYGAMASWGEHAVGGPRLSAGRPTKSAVVGLLAAALGVHRSEEKALLALQRGYGFAVRVEAAGELLRDYHTTQVPSAQKKVVYATRREELQKTEKKKINTILSQRDYHLDACYSVAFWSRESAPYALSVLQEALYEPKFALYLGRKS